LHQNSLDELAKATGAHQQRLEAAERGMGLSIPGRGVQAPTLGYELDSFQVQAMMSLDGIPCLQTTLTMPLLLALLLLARKQ
jgi:hypothetical protein